MDKELHELMLSENPIKGIEDWCNKKSEERIRKNDRIWLLVLMLICLVIIGTTTGEKEKKEDATRTTIPNR